MTASHVFVLFAGIGMGALLRIATFRAATLMLFLRIIDRQALFLMEWKGEGARAAALQAAERERWRVSPDGEAYWLKVAARIEALGPGRYRG
jgi:hypothetical protein